MPGMFGIIGEFNKVVETNSMLETINPLSLGCNRITTMDEGILAVSWLKNDPLLSSLYYEDASYITCFSGDLIHVKKIPWESIINNIEKGRYEHFSDYRGTFSFVIFNKNNKRLSIVSDMISQQPIYYFITNNTFIYSTAISTFCKLENIPEFNVNWLYEFLFFNHPIGQTTFFKNIFRMPPATILEYDLSTHKFSMIEYTVPFTRLNNLVKGKKAFELALSVFNERVPKYFEKNTENAVSLTGGLDSRTILSMAPKEAINSLKTYTYGVPICHDLMVASKVSSILKLPHIEIYFDKDFLDRLPDLIYETVYLSNGLERVSRSTLPYVYKMLTNEGKCFPIIITGVSGDHLFRDHIMGTGNVPAMISSDMMQIFHKGEVRISKNFFKTAYGDNFKYFEQHIYKAVQKLQSKYGKLNTPESYLSFLIYETTPKHFAGEAAIANNFSKFRTPYWDADIIRLSYEIEYGTLGFSESLNKKDKYRECALQAFLIQNNISFSKIPYNGISLRSFSKNNKFLYNVNRIVRRGPKKIISLIKPTPYSPLEDWSNWFKVILDEEINKIISEDSLISNYLTLEFLEQMKKEKNVHWLGKILAAEIILRLIKNRWVK